MCSVDLVIVICFEGECWERAELQAQPSLIFRTLDAVQCGNIIIAVWFLV